MKLCYSKQDIDKISPYRENYNLTVYPKRFPAFVEFESRGGGIGGEYWVMKILEIPLGVDIKSFILGKTSKATTYGKNIFKKK